MHMYSVHGWCPFCMNYCLNAAVRMLSACGTAEVLWMTRMLQWRPSALWHWSVSCLFSFSWQCPTDSLLGSGQAGVCWPIKDSIPWSLNQVLVVLAVCAGAKSCWKIKSASPRSQSLEKNWRGTECKMLEVQCEVSTICVGLGSHVICWCWSTVLY